ncbi:MAG TPA: CoA transferase [Pirellulales bacterium]|jgi:crotonobetainyl-CoA:carnitine CoA-transferase CaiB-like acyl-CoA transferase|nr:CoA transferase [Pirellulales bacterium]
MARLSRPLDGVRVLDLSRVLAGPFCSQLLADLGADVVKVERPPLGDDTRQWGPPFLPDEGPSAYYVSCNRGKRSLALDLARPEAREVLDDLIRAADVLIENFLPQSLEKLGLAPERLEKLNPRLIRASISGYGRTGPAAATPGYDLVVQATAGIMSITGEPDGSPMKIGVAITDVLTGLYAAVSVLAGLYQRSESLAATRQGSAAPAFDLALADCTLAAMVNVVQGALVTGDRPQRYGNAHPQIVPYEAFATADGYLVLAVGNDQQWQRFCAAVSHPEWGADPRFATNPARVERRGELIPLLNRLFIDRGAAAWQALLTSAEVPHAPVTALDEILATPQVAARRMVRELTGTDGRTYRVVASPIHCDGEPFCSPRSPPTIGEHSGEILREWLGYAAERAARLREQKVLD